MNSIIRAINLKQLNIWLWKRKKNYKYFFTCFLVVTHLEYTLFNVIKWRIYTLTDIKLFPLHICISYVCHSGNSNPVPFLIPLVVVPINYHWCWFQMELSLGLFLIPLVLLPSETTTSGACNWKYQTITLCVTSD